MNAHELARHYEEDLHTGSEDDEPSPTPHDALLTAFRNGNRQAVVAWFVCRSLAQPGYALVTLSELSRRLTRHELERFQELLPEDN